MSVEYGPPSSRRSLLRGQRLRASPFNLFSPHLLRSLSPSLSIPVDPFRLSHLCSCLPLTVYRLFHLPSISRSFSFLSPFFIFSRILNFVISFFLFHFIYLCYTRCYTQSLPDFFILLQFSFLDGRIPCLQRNRRKSSFSSPSLSCDFILISLFPFQFSYIFLQI